MRADLQNPYWREVQTFPNARLRFSRDAKRFEPDMHPGLLENNFDEKRSRTHLVKYYSWAIPTDEQIFWLAQQMDGRRIVEIGAGTGYWAWLLYQAGVTVIAYDQHATPLDNTYFADDAKTFHPILPGHGPDVVRNHPHDVLMLCWPNYGESFAVDTLRAYDGNTLIFIGEGEGGCTGDDDFFAELHENWSESAFCPHFVQWSGIHDLTWIYTRNVPSANVIKEAP